MLSINVLRFFFLVSLLGAFPSFSSGSEHSSSGDMPVFTNKDIEKYKSSSDNNSPAAYIARPSANPNRARDIKEDREKDYWCKKAAPFRNNIEKTGDEIKEVEKELGERKDKGLSGGKTEKSLQKRLVRSKKQLKYAERDLAQIENDAHRKGIPPGWLRCQFD